MPSLQFSLVSIMELVHEGVLTVEQLVQKMCHAPAELFQIEKRGYIRPGYKADLVLVNPDSEWGGNVRLCFEQVWMESDGRTKISFTSRKNIRQW